MRIPIFVSSPTVLNARQEAQRAVVISQLKRLDLEPRALGRTDYPTDNPVKEVLAIARHCSGGIILGFEQLYAAAATLKRGTTEERSVNDGVRIPTPWNQLEAGVLVCLGIPLLIFKEDGIKGGVFDEGVTDSFVHRMPSVSKSRELNAVFLKWQARVREHYYRGF